jgi:ABC-type glycerol-3-phosphate transport system substrate-binding protein
MKKLLLVLGAVLILLGSCSKKQGTPSVSSAETGGSNKLVVWTAVEDVATMIDTYYKPTHPDVTVEYTMVTGIQDKLDPLLAAGQGVPDVFSMEIAYVRRYIESGLLLDITDIYEANKDKIYQYTADIATHNNKVYGLAWQTTPGVVYYRRSLAKQYLGSDAPDTVQTFFSDPRKFMETAEIIKQKSGGACYIVPEYSMLYMAFANNRQEPWVVDGRLVVDPLMLEYMDLAKTIRDRGYDARIRDWSDAWYASLNGNAKDENGRSIEILANFRPAWGLFYVYMPGASETSGDWAIVPGPYTYFEGGTWLGAWHKTRNVPAVKEFIRYFTTDDDLLEKWVANTFDMISNINVVEKLTKTVSVPFLGGQNPYVIYADLTRHISGRLVQGTDGAIRSIFEENVAAFVNGEKTKEQALADFREQVNSQLGY